MRPTGLTRRDVLGSLAAASIAGADDATAIIDTHTHFYDPTRAEGVPWPPKDDRVLYRPVLPAEYVNMTRPLGIAGTIVVEASSWLEDNQWVLDLAKRNPVIVGVVGHLEPGKPEFASRLERFARDPLFRGIRLTRFPLDPPFIADLKRLASADMELDVLGGPGMLADVVRLSDRAPELRIVIDHLPFDPPQETARREAFRAALKELGGRPQVYAKVSNVLRRGLQGSDGYRDALEQLWAIFGADRVVYGSNWPVSDMVAPYADVLRVVREFFATKGREATEKYFSKNSVAAYRWRRRGPSAA